MSRHSRWALFLVLVLALGWIGGLAAPAAGAAPLPEQSAEAADSWSPVGGTLAFAPLAAGASSRGVALKTLAATLSPSAPVAFLAVDPVALLPNEHASAHSAVPLCRPLRC